MLENQRQLLLQSAGNTGWPSNLHSFSLLIIFLENSLIKITDRNSQLLHSISSRCNCLIMSLKIHPSTVGENNYFDK